MKNTARALFVYDVAGSFSDGLAAVQKDGKYGYIDKEGDEKIPFIYDNAWEFHDGLARVKRGGKYGYVNVSGTERIDCRFNDDHGFYNGLVLVKEKSSWGYYDKTGKMVTPIIYQDIYEYILIPGGWGRRRILS